MVLLFLSLNTTFYGFNVSQKTLSYCYLYLENREPKLPILLDQVFALKKIVYLKII